MYRPIVLVAVMALVTFAAFMAFDTEMYYASLRQEAEAAEEKEAEQKATDKIIDKVVEEAMVDECLEWSDGYCDEEMCRGGQCALFPADLPPFEIEYPSGRVANMQIGFHQTKICVWREVE